MIFRQLTGTGDWTFGKGRSGYATAQQAVELNILTRLLSWKGDCFFAADDHVDWLGRLDKGQVANLNNELKRVLLASFGVVRVAGFSGTLNPVTRGYRVVFTIDTIFGTGFLNQLNLTAGLATGS